MVDDIIRRFRQGRKPLASRGSADAAGTSVNRAIDHQIEKEIQPEMPMTIGQMCRSRRSQPGALLPLSRPETPIYLISYLLIGGPGRR
jgi:hypothetical protein